MRAQIEKIIDVSCLENVTVGTYAVRAAATVGGALTPSSRMTGHRHTSSYSSSSSSGHQPSRDVTGTWRAPW